MCGTTSSEDEKTKSNESDSFKFAVTLLAAFGTIIYTTYTYLQNNPLDIYWYVFVCGLLCVGVVCVFGLLLYIFIKAFLMEEYNGKQRGLEKLASSIYSITLLTSTRLLLFVVVAFALVYIEKFQSVLCVAVVVIGVLFIVLLCLHLIKDKPKWKITLLASTSLVLFILLAFTWAYIEKFQSTLCVGVVAIVVLFIVLLCLPLIQDKLKGKERFWWFVTVAITLILGAIIWHLLFGPVLISPLQGHITVEMDSIYYKDDTQIPVLIHVTGPNTDLSIKLYQEESGHDLILKDNITEYLEPEHNLSKTKSGENLTLLANSLGSGKYNVFINTTNLTIGYYKLICIRQKYTKPYGAKGFYLLNSSQRS